MKQSLLKQAFTIFMVVLVIQLNFSIVSGLQISNAEVLNVTGDSARISWQTDEPANSTLRYGITQLTEEITDSSLNLSHEFTLNNLQNRAIYSAMAISENQNDSDNRPGLEIFTVGQSTGTVDNTTIETDLPSSNDPLGIPRAVNQDRLTINGTTEANSEIRFFVNSEDVPSQILETGDFAVESDSNGNFIATIQLYETVYKGKRGYNEIKIKITDSDNNVLEERRIVVVDTIAPQILTEDFNEFTNNPEIELKGALSEEATLSYIVGDTKDDQPSQGNSIQVREDLSFEERISLGGDGVYPLTLIAEDEAGNRISIEYEIHVDNTPCQLTFTEDTEQEVFTQEQRFSIVNLHGDTSEPNCKVTVVNFKDNVPGDLTQEELDDLIDEFKFDLQLGIAGTIIGGVRDYTSDEDGDIEITVALAESIIDQGLGRIQGRDTLQYQTETVGVNNIRFLIEDRAGNKNFVDRTILFEPGSNAWKTGVIQTIPNTVYSNNLFAERSQGVDVALIYDMHYLGPGADIKNVRTTARLDGAKYDNHHINVKESFSRWYPEENRLFVYTKITVHDGGTNNVEELLRSLEEDDIGDTGTGSQIDMSLVTTVTYDLVAVDGESQRFSEDVYYKHAVGLETPFDYTKFLTPEMIKEAIDVLDEAVLALEKMVEIADIATLGLTAGCVAMTAANYFAGDAALDTALKRTYYVCDRVWCPTIPRDCADVSRVATTSTGQRFLEKDGKYYRESDDDYSSPVSVPDGVTYSFEQNNNDVRTTYSWVEGNRAQDSYGTRLCPPGMNAIEIREQNTTQSSVIFGDYRGYSRGYSSYTGRSLGSGNLRYECTQATREQFRTEARPADIGCYTPPGGPPAFHETKCVPDDVDRINNNGDVNPYDDIFTSARCGCVSGVRGHLANILRITQGFQKCLHQALIGEVRGGYCERLFAQFVCDLISSVVKSVLQSGQDAAGFESGEGFSIRENFQAVNDRLRARYGNIIQNQYGLSSDQLVHKACVAAITGDWTDLNTVFQQSGRVAVAPVIGPMLPESRFNAYNPFTGEASINYYTTLGVLSGGQEVSGTFRVICDKSKPGGEYCPSDRPIVIYEEAIYVEAGGSLETNVFFTDETARFWGNLAVLDLRYNLGDQPQVQKIIEEQVVHKGPVLAQCHFQVLPPGFTCETLTGGTSALEFEDASLTPNVNTYYPGDIVWLKTELGLFGALGTGVTPIEGTFSQPSLDNPNVFLVYDLTKPNGFESNRRDQSKLNKFRVSLDDSVKTKVYELLKFSESLGTTTASSYVFEGSDKFEDILDDSYLPFEHILIEPNQTRLITATSSNIVSGTFTSSGSQPRNIYRLELKNAAGNKLLCTTNNNAAECINRGSTNFEAVSLAYTVEASASNDNFKFETQGLGFKPIDRVTQRTGGSSLEYPPGTYTLNITLYQDLFDPTQIDDRDIPVAYGETDIQSHSLSFNLAARPNCDISSQKPSLEIIYPTRDEYITRNLMSASTQRYGGGVYISLQDDCNSLDEFKSVRLFDAKGLQAAEEQIRSETGLTPERREDIYNTFSIAHYSGGNIQQKESAANLVYFTGETISPYLENDAFDLIVRVTDSHGNTAEDTVTVISSSTIGGGATPISDEELSCQRFSGQCSPSCDLSIEDDLGPCDSRRCCRLR